MLVFTLGHIRSVAKAEHLEQSARAKWKQLKSSEKHLSEGKPIKRRFFNRKKLSCLYHPFTDLEWAKLFHSAKGFVVEVRGIMPHGAVVDREYGIPAVAGIDNATALIKDGDDICADGT
ncbi:PEP-utilizing enzyme [Neobacillus mesonae]|uniref:PEP-utilizing enzyme n=1 Tax=Neobacillus mesonae TaxID=1193713 RepID=UPI00288ABBD3|nr:PEP-utilizing enzyme [Neobacillus mesonae]